VDPRTWGGRLRPLTTVRYCRQAVSDAGIDLDGTRDLMVAWLFARGMTSHEALDALRDRLREQHRVTLSAPDTSVGKAQWRRDVACHDIPRLIEWQVAARVAHLHEGHGCPKSIDDVVQPRCPILPCKIEAVSLALMELIDHYHGEFGANRVYRLLAERLEKLARRPRGKGELLAEIRALCVELSESEIATQRLVRPEFRRPRLSVACLAAISPPNPLREKLLELAESIRRDVFLSPSHRRVNSGRGRPPQRLRNSLYQHLCDAKFTQGQAEELIVDEGGAFSPNSKGRIQKRVSRSDDRSIVPWEVHVGERTSQVGRAKRAPPATPGRRRQTPK
jgi:hypothetical protein